MHWMIILLIGFKTVANAQVSPAVTNVNWETIQERWYYAQLTGQKAHSWRDAFNRCARLKPGNPYPAIFPNETGIATYLIKRYKELNIDPGKVYLKFLI